MGLREGGGGGGGEHVVDVSRVLRRAADATPAKRSKNGAPAADDSSGAVADYVAASCLAKEAEAERKLALARLLEVADGARASMAQAAGGLAPGSVRMVAGAESATVTWPNRYSAPDLDAAAGALEVAGDRAGRWFSERRTLRLRDAAAADDATLAELIAALGENRFVTLFEVSVTLSPTEAYHRERYALPSDEQAELDATFRPCSPIVRT